MESSAGTSAPWPLAFSAERALRALERVSGSVHLAELSGERLLSERVRLTNTRFVSGQSAGGSCRLLPTLDGTLAVNLPRMSDWELLPAWLGQDLSETVGWSGLARALEGRRAAPLIEQARLLGMAVALAAAPDPATLELSPDLVESGSPRSRVPKVVDLSALWSGPLCGALLRRCGAEVTKVESSRRPDGARFGNRQFFELLNAGKHSVQLDLGARAGQRRLEQLIRGADIVIEASRPRALQQMGIDAETILESRPQLIWISITGYGRDEPRGSWVAFGDDAGVAAGLSHIMRAATGSYEIAGDAIADPLTGIHAALTGWQHWRSGTGGLVGMSLRDVVAGCLAQESNEFGESLHRRFADWWRSVRC
jgi:hypothetical protein